MAKFEGYDEEAVKAEKKAAKETKNLTVVDWRNVKGDIITIDYYKPKKLLGLAKRISETAPVFGLCFWDTDFKYVSGGDVVIYSEVLHAAKAFKNYRPEVTYFQLEREFVLKDERLIKNCDIYLQNLLAAKPGFGSYFLAILFGLFIISGITYIFPNLQGAWYFGLAIAVVFAIPEFFVILNMAKKGARAGKRDRAIRESKEIWKELKQKAQQQPKAAPAKKAVATKKTPVTKKAPQKKKRK